MGTSANEAWEIIFLDNAPLAVVVVWACVVEDVGEVIPEVMVEDETPVIAEFDNVDEGAPVDAPTGEVAVPVDNGADGMPTPLFVTVVVGPTFTVEVNVEVIEPDMTVLLVTTVLAVDEALDVVLVVVTFVMVNSALMSPESPNTSYQTG